MFCGECGTENPDTNQFCKNCGKPLKKKQLQPAPAVVTAAPPQHIPPVPFPAIPKKPGSSKKFIIIGAVIVVVIIAAIFLMTQTGSPINGVTAPGAKASEPVHGTISTGPAVEAAAERISANGGTIIVNKPGSPINGLKFAAPAGAYPSGQQVTISSAPITGNTFGSDLNPATHMISIEAGKGYADEPVFVTIPVQIPDGQFAPWRSTTMMSIKNWKEFPPPAKTANRSRLLPVTSQIFLFH
jgi:zinc-ribbon domain